MDKARFLSSSPNYYALAVAVFFLDNRSAQRQKIIGDFSYRDEFDERNLFRLRDNALLQLAIRLLVDWGMIDLVEDDFGPQILVKAPKFSDAWIRVESEQIGSFGNYARLGDDGYAWLLSALDKLNALYDELGVSDDDFLQPDREWSPLPLDRENPDLANAIESLDNAITQVEGDNGYAANLPEERSYVVGSLRQTSDRLKKDGSISIAYLKKNAFDPLSTVARRFSGAALGAAARGAALALLKYLEMNVSEHVLIFLRGMFGL